MSAKFPRGGGAGPFFSSKSTTSDIFVVSFISTKSLLLWIHFGKVPFSISLKT